MLMNKSDFDLLAAKLVAIIIITHCDTVSIAHQWITGLYHLKFVNSTRLIYEDVVRECKIYCSDDYELARSVELAGFSVH